MPSGSPSDAALTLHWFPLTVPAERRAVWSAWLSPEERARADRFRNPAHGERYLAAHAHLRWLLARALGLAPEAVAFTRGAHGKPRLAAGAWRFNLSHSGALGLVGLHPHLELGVDVEAERARNFLGLAGRFFSPAEQIWLAAQPEAGRAHAFARLWTCKEAWMKADGRGLAVLRQPEVSLSSVPPRLRARGQAWWCEELSLPSGYAAAAVMAEAPDSVIAQPLRLPPG